ncbi:uncharacterized protein METZ01_LOCUS437228, partial [marine metagenome]
HARSYICNRSLSLCRTCSKVHFNTIHKEKVKNKIILEQISKISVIFFACWTFMSSQTLEVKKIAQEFQRPVYLTAPKNQSDTLFVIEQKGTIQTLIRGHKSNLLLDVRDRVHQPRMPGDERGLLGMALHPNFHNNGKFYVNYVNRDGTTIISCFFIKHDQFSADPNLEEIILSINQPYSNHNGGQLAFGPNGYLYIGLGDGGHAGDPENNGQNLNTFLGSILRLDINEKKPYFIPSDNPHQGSDEKRPEIYCHGLRNPWRFS